MPTARITACLCVSALTAPALAAPTPTPFNLNAGGGAVFTGFEPDTDDALSILTYPPGTGTFVIADATIGGSGDAFDGMFELGGQVGADTFTIKDDDGVVDLTAVAGAGSRVVIDAVADPVPAFPIDFDVEFFVFSNEPVARMVVTATNNGVAPTGVAIEMASDSGTPIPVEAATFSGDFVVDNADRWHVRLDNTPFPDPLQTHVQFGVDAPVAPSIVRINPGDDDDTQVLFNLSLAPGESQSLMYFAAVTDPNSPTALADAVALADRLDDSLFELSADGFLAGLSPSTIASIVNYSGAIPGDANGDGVVDLLDFDVLAQQFGQNVSGGPTQGDFNGDGVVDLLDFDILAQNFGASFPVLVPEPASAALLGLGGLLLAHSRRASRFA